MSGKPIGVFDSGLGGLAVARQVMNEMPEEDILYFSDFKNLPYGPRPQSEVKTFTLKIIDFLISMGAKAVIIACNTASAAGGDAARDRSKDVRVIGMIEAALKATLALGDAKRVGVVATKGTIDSRAYVEAFKKDAPGIQVFGQPCEALLRLAEQGDIEDKIRILTMAKDCVAPVLAEKVDTVILGCTDFTCIDEQMLAVLDPSIRVVDPALESVKLADAFLRQTGQRNSAGKGTIRFFASGPGPEKSESFARRVFDIDMKDIGIVDI